MSEISAKTCVNVLPRLFKQVAWEPNTINFDIGGGRYDKATKYLSGRGVENIIYDPYNRTTEENSLSMAYLHSSGAHSATISNVLCVIEDEGERQSVLSLARMVVKLGGAVYISVYEGNGSGIPTISSKGTWQANRRLYTYLSEVRKVFPICEIRKGIIVARVS